MRSMLTRKKPQKICLKKMDFEIIDDYEILNLVEQIHNPKLQEEIIKVLWGVEKNGC